MTTTSIRPLAISAAVSIFCLAVTAAVSATLSATGGETTGVEAAVIAAVGLASLVGIGLAVRWAARTYDRMGAER